MGTFDFLSRKTPDEKVVDDLIHTVRVDPKRRYDALVSLKKIGNLKSLDTFYEMLHDPSPRIRKISISALSELGDISAIDYLSKLIATHDFSYNGKRTNYGHTENITLANEAILKIQQRSIVIHEDVPPINSNFSEEDELITISKNNGQEHIPLVNTPAPTSLPTNRKSTELICILMRNHGISIIGNPIAFNGLLNDYYRGEYKKEVRILSTSVEENIPQDIISRKNQIPFQILYTQLIQRLINCGFSEDLSNWAVQAWVEALGVKAD